MSDKNKTTQKGVTVSASQDAVKKEMTQSGGQQLLAPQFSSVGAAPPVKLTRSSKAIISLLLQVFFIVILTTGIAIAYFGFVASDRYVSSTQIVIQSNEGQTPLGLQSLVGGSAASLMGGGGTGRQGDILATYIQSTSMMGQLEELLSLREMYAPNIADKFSKLDEDASKEDFLAYYQSRVTVLWDAQTHLLSIEAQAFSARDAKLILDTIIMLSEEKLNSLTERKQRDLVSFAREELGRAENRLKAARLAVTSFRQTNGEINPLSTAESTSGLLASIHAQVAAERAQLSSMLFVMKANSPQIKGLRARITALEAEAAIEKTRLTGTSGRALSDLVSQYEELILEEEFARATYVSAVTFLENTRAQAQQESSYVVDFVSANLPDEATEPHRLIIIFTVFVVSLLVWGIGTLIVAAIKEQARI